MSFAAEIPELDVQRSCKAIKIFRDGTMKEVVVGTPVEGVIDVYVNGQKAMVLTCTPSNVRELVLGHLFTEGFIRKSRDVVSLILDDREGRVDVILEGQGADLVRQVVEHVDTCGRKTGALAKDGIVECNAIGKSEIDVEQVFFMARVFAEDTPLHMSTLGVHSCSLFEGRRLLYTFEDLGRHNAFDKALGAALADDRDMSKLAVLSSGRIPVDMVSKAICAQIPLLVTKATPTMCSVSIARAHGLTLVGRVRPDSFCVFSEQLECDELTTA